jgi:hypothetical protein
VHALYCILAVLRDAGRSDRRIRFAVQLDAQDVSDLRAMLADGFDAFHGLDDWGYALCTHEDAVGNGHVDVRYCGSFGDSHTDAPLHGTFGSRYVGTSDPLPEHTSQVHAGDVYVSLPGDVFAGEPLTPGTLVGWDTDTGEHYPAGRAESSLYHGQYGVGSLLWYTGTLHRVVEPYCPVDCTVAIVPVAQGMRGPVTRAPMASVTSWARRMGSTYAPLSDVELGETVTDLVGDASDVGGVSLWDLQRSVGCPVDHIVRALCDADVLQVAHVHPSRGATTYVHGVAR